MLACLFPLSIRKLVTDNNRFSRCVILCRRQLTRLYNELFQQTMINGFLGSWYVFWSRKLSHKMMKKLRFSQRIYFLNIFFFPFFVRPEWVDFLVEINHGKLSSIMITFLLHSSSANSAIGKFFIILTKISVTRGKFEARNESLSWRPEVKTFQMDIDWAFIDWISRLMGRTSPQNELYSTFSMSEKSENFKG